MAHVQSIDTLCIYAGAAGQGRATTNVQDVCTLGIAFTILSLPSLMKLVDAFELLQAMIYYVCGVPSIYTICIYTVCVCVLIDLYVAVDRVCGVHSLFYFCRWFVLFFCPCRFWLIWDPKFKSYKARAVCRVNCSLPC